MRIRLISIISVGITIGFLLGMAAVGLLRAVVDGKTPGLEIAFTLMVCLMGGFLLYYVFRLTK